MTSEQLEAAGILFINDVASHHCGDEYAAKILSGEIPIEVAIAQEREAEHRFNQMEHRLRSQS